mmetsp:Transcript_24066/g.45424  ORF Transcript_24066/g.45424 Transcript_24066/m.45424 type:complete len:237 (+) Transcript_24066:102-812(+)
MRAFQSCHLGDIPHPARTPHVGWKRKDGIAAAVRHKQCVFLVIGTSSRLLQQRNLRRIAGTIRLDCEQGPPIAGEENVVAGQAHILYHCLVHVTGPRQDLWGVSFDGLRLEKSPLLLVALQVGPVDVHGIRSDARWAGNEVQLPGAHQRPALRDALGHVLGADHRNEPSLRVSVEEVSIPVNSQPVCAVLEVTRHKLLRVCLEASPRSRDLVAIQKPDLWVRNIQPPDSTAFLVQR